jgi:hypothetical protein
MQDTLAIGLHLGAFTPVETQIQGASRHPRMPHGEGTSQLRMSVEHRWFKE